MVCIHSVYVPFLWGRVLVDGESRFVEGEFEDIST